MLIYHGKHNKSGHVESLPLEGTANTEFCDCDKIERKCWWYLPVAVGIVVLAYGLGWVSAAWSIYH